MANDFGLTPFRWSQLESTDYRQYIANLRGIGCPEQTIRDIVTADVASLYERKRNELKSILAGSGLSGALEKLAEEQGAVLLALLGRGPGEASPLAEVSPHGFVHRNLDRVTVPLALQQVDLTGLNFSPRQLAGIAQARLRFEQEVENTGLAPADPAYRALWQKAQAESDDLLQAVLGGERYIDYQLAARNASAAGAN